jgi:UDP:flavonoid glycosyltransferase YjiC (YdhE family)
MVPVTRVAGEKEVSSEELRAAVRRALTDPILTANAQRLSERLRAYGGVGRAADLIEQFSCEHAIVE